ncbi:MAG: hypothetical protein ACLFPS_07385 [Clostridia bacterium]
MKTVKTISVVLLVIFLLTACNQESAQEPVDNNTPPEEEQFEEKVIEDEEILNDLWSSILFDSITSIGNANSFESPEDLEVSELAKFAYIKTVREEGFDSLKRDDENRYIVKNEKIKEIADYYFNLENIDFSKIEDRAYLEEENGFAYHFTPQEEMPDYDESNPWSIYFDKLTQIEDNSYRARLITYFGSEKEYIKTEWLYELEKNNSKWIIKSMEKSYPDHGLVKIEGEVEQISEIKNYPKKLGGEDNLRILTTTEEKLIVTSDIRTENEYTNILGIIDIETMTMINYIDVGKDIYGINVKEENAIVKLKDEVVVYDYNLNIVERIEVPERIQSLEDREASYDDNQNVLTWYGGYDINSDLSQICYTDEEGLKLYYVDDGEDSLRFETPQFPNDSMAPYGYLSQPKFIEEDSKILVSMVGYEGIRDFLVHDLSGINPTYELEVGSYSILLHDINGKNLIGINKDEGVQIQLSTLETTDLEAKWPLRGEHEMQQQFVYNEDEKFAFTLKNHETDETLIYVVDVSKNTIDGPVATVEKGDVNIIGVLDDGSILCSYNYYLNESGYFKISD